MKIEFENEMDLAQTLFNGNINLATFTTLFLDKFGVLLPKSSQAKIINAEQKREKREENKAAWCKGKNVPIYTESDIPSWAAESVTERAGASLHTALFNLYGETKPGSLSYSDIYLDVDRYLFTKDGLIQIMSKFMFNKLIDEFNYWDWYNSINK